MPQTIHRGIKVMIDEANAEIETISAADAITLIGKNDVVIVDIRDPREIERDGKIPGAFSCTRGMLEFWIDPNSPYAKPIFQEDKKFIFHCAGGLRSALAAKTAKDMGLKPVAHMGGGFAAWREAGELVDPHTAVALAVADRDTTDTTVPNIVLSTAHPAKFPDAVEAACGQRPLLPAWLDGLMTKSEHMKVMKNDQSEVERFVLSVSRAAKQGVAG